MSKQFTDIPLVNFDAVKPSTLTSNTDKYIGEFNGELDANNLPVDSVTYNKLVRPIVPQADTGGTQVKESASMPSQRYFITKINNQTLGNDIWTPSLTLNLDTDNWSKGFNHMPALDATWEDYQLRFEAQEGSLVGCATIDWEHGCQVYQVTVEDDPPLSDAMSRGNGWWTEWAVFVNNVLVARTGFIYPRRHTTQLPFTVPCGSQSIEIDVRCRINTNWQSGGPLGPSPSTPFNVWSTTIWCRNVYR